MPSVKMVDGKQVYVGSEDDPDSKEYGKAKPYKKPSEVSTADLGAAARANAPKADNKKGEVASSDSARLLQLKALRTLPAPSPVAQESALAKAARENAAKKKSADASK